MTLVKATICGVIGIVSVVGDLLLLLANIATFLGLPIAAYELHSQAKTARESFNREKKQKTLDKYNELVHFQIIKKARELDEHLHKMSLGELGESNLSEAQIEPDGQLDMLLRDYFSILEPFATDINEGIYDLEFFDKLYGVELIKAWKTVGFYPAYLQKRTQLDDIYLQCVQMMDKLHSLHAVGKS
ncbi:DUF4760 domain-containing protein [Adlercreutzia sp. ZJ141]|uniref:DUF4760 domain-containing protein n=1 Tax=Adlercreutzia sp. ZJ141 TaxID=2709406 RepID=UPI0013EDFDA6|nr:hypothetical protein [Adlercreutzia sp. ZJ141]